MHSLKPTRVAASAIFLAWITITNSVTATTSRRQSALFCMPLHTWDTDFQNASVMNASSPQGAITNAHGGLRGDTWVMCPVVSDSNVSHGSADLFHIHGLDADSSPDGWVSAEICADFFNWDGVTGNGFTCSSRVIEGNTSIAIAANATGPYQIEWSTTTTPDLSVWTNNGTAFPYFMILLGSQGNATAANGYSNVNGFYLQNN